MERPRRNVRLPGSLNDYLTVDENERKNETIDDVSDVMEDDNKQEGGDIAVMNESDKLITSQPYKCGDCKARYRSKVALLRHVVKHTGDKPFTCPECGKGLSSQCALSEHTNIHTNTRPHRCEDCGQESRQLSVHLRHLLTHQSQPENSYSCTICAKTFKQNEYLKRHMRKHTGEKPFECELCGKAFTCKSELNSHKKRHSSERPHVCPECGQTFKMRHNLRKHLKAHAGTQQWKCVLCPEVFAKPKHLEEHRKTHVERVHHMHVDRQNQNTLVVSTEGSDRRRLPTVQNVILPKEKHSNVFPAASLQKKIPRRNETTLPLELIMKSIGKGQNIKIKIIDKPPPLKPDPFPNIKNVVEIISYDAEVFPKSKLINGSSLIKNQNFAEERMKTVNFEPVEVASVLSISASIESHCLSNHYLHVNPASEEYRCWLATCASLCQQLQPPFELEVCKHLHHVTSSLQYCLIHGSGSNAKEFPNDANNISDTVFCRDYSQYQFIYEQYAIIMEKLQMHMNCSSGD